MPSDMTKRMVATNQMYVAVSVLGQLQREATELSLKMLKNSNATSKIRLVLGEKARINAELVLKVGESMLVCAKVIEGKNPQESS